MAWLITWHQHVTSSAFNRSRSGIELWYNMQPPDHQQLYHLLHTAVDVKTVKQRDSHTLQQASVYCGITHSRAKNFSKRCQLNVFVDVEKSELQNFWRLFNFHYWCWFIDTGFKIKVSINVMLNFFLTSATDISRTFCGMNTSLCYEMRITSLDTDTFTWMIVTPMKRT